MFLSGDLPYTAWCRWGGKATLESYGVTPCSDDASEATVSRVRNRFNKAIPKSHISFFTSLKWIHLEANYLFVHAGIRPGLGVEEQQTEDLIFIREEFLSSPVTIKETVVHGHTIFEKPHVRDKSIGIDTGAYKTGILTALAIDDNGTQFLETTLAP